MRSAISIVFIIFLTHAAKGQQKFSFKFDFKNKRISSQAELFSVSVKDNSVFLHQYEKQVGVKLHHPGSRTFHLVATREWVVKNLTDDDNIIFVDIIRPPHHESLNESANPAFNRVNLM